MLALLWSVALAATVTLRTSDGKSISGAYERPSGATKGVVFVHMVGGSSADWAGLAAKVQRGGMATLAVDLRGHGASAKAASSLSDGDYQAALADVQAAVAYLRSKGVTDVSCAGASIGANLCLKAAVADPAIVNLALLSPGLNYKGVQIQADAPAYGNRPMLLVASTEDSFADRTVTLLGNQAAGQKHVVHLTDADHGTKMLNRDATLEGLVLSWLLGTFQLAGGEVVVPKPAVRASERVIETTGKKLGAHQ